MGQAGDAAIRMTEAAYDLHVSKKDWFPRVMEAAVALIDHGLGVAGLVGTMPRDPSEPQVVEELHVATGPLDFPLRLMRAMGELPHERIRSQVHSGIGVLSEVNAEEPRFMEAWRRHIDYAEDGIGVTGMDPNGRGVHIIAPVPKTKTLTRAERGQWQMLAAHLSAGLRLRGAVSATHGEEAGKEDLPCGADAVLDANSFGVTDAIKDARLPDSLRDLRNAAVRIDRARGRLRHDNPQKALKIWWALLRGRWSMVEWFDTDDRRYMLAVPNAPRISDPRGLTERESQVVSYAALGDSHKLIGYRLGVSRSRVSNALNSAMRKLNVKTQAQLVEKLRVLAAATEAEPEK